MQKVKRYAVIFLLCIAGFFLQSVFMPLIKLGSVMPNLLVIITSLYGFVKGGKEGVFAGFVCGLCYDIAYGNSIGTYALIFVIIGFMNAYLHKVIGDDHRHLPLYFVAGSDLLYGFICYICFYMLQGEFIFWHSFVNIIIPEMLYTIAAAIPVYPALTAIERKMDRTASKKEDKFV